MSKAIEVEVVASFRDFVQRVMKMIESITQTIRSILNSPAFKDCVRQLEQHKQDRKSMRQLYYRKKRSQAKRKGRRRDYA